MERLAEKLAITAEALEELGGIVRVLENRQVDLSVLRIGILPLLRKIAYGQLLPGLVARFAGKGQLLKYVQNLAIPDQKRLLAGEKMRVLLLGDGGTDALMVEPERMTSKQIMQVFDDHIRDDGEQRSWLEDHRKPPKPPEEYTVDIRRGGVTINGKWFSRADLAALLARLG